MDSYFRRNEKQALNFNIFPKDFCPLPKFSGWNKMDDEKRQELRDEHRERGRMAKKEEERIRREDKDPGKRPKSGLQIDTQGYTYNIAVSLKHLAILTRNRTGVVQPDTARPGYTPVGHFDTLQ